MPSFFDKITKKKYPPCYEKPLSRANCGVEEANHSDISTTRFLHPRDHCVRRPGNL